MVMQGALPTVATWLLHGTSSSDFLKITPYPVHDPRLPFTISLIAFSFC